MSDRVQSGTDRQAGEDGEDSCVPIQFHEAWGEVRRRKMELPVTFRRAELDLILRLYGRMVAAGEWRDYAIDHRRDRAVFSVYRRANEIPLFQIVKTPSLARRQGAFSVTAASGLILKRGHELQRVLALFDKAVRPAAASTRR